MHERRSISPLWIGCVMFACAPLTARAQVIPANLIAYEGQVVLYNGASVTLGYHNMPVVNSLGTPAFSAESATTTGNTVWRDDRVVWRNSDALPDILVGSSDTMGLSDAGDFIYVTLMNNKATVYTNYGKLLSSGDPHPALPGMFVHGSSLPMLTPNGTAYWVGSHASIPNASAAEGRIILKCTDISNPATITKVVQSGDVVDGQTISHSTWGSWRFGVSNDQTQFMHSMLVDATPTPKERVVVNGAVVASAGSPTGGGDIYQEFFQNLNINNYGNYIFTANTTGLPGSNRVLAYNSTVVLRRGMAVDGFTLGSAIRGAGLNNRGKLVFMWSAPTNEVLFYGDADNAAASKAILREGDQLDFNNDGFADATVAGMHAGGNIGPGMSLSDHDFVFVNVDLVDIPRGGEYNAIVRINLPPHNDCAADISGDGTVNVSDLLAVITAWGPNSGPADINGDGTVNVADLLAVITAWGPCP